MSRQNKTIQPVLGCDIGNGYAYVSILQSPDADPQPLFPSKYNLFDLGMPTAAYVSPPQAETISVFENGRPAEKRYGKYPRQLVRTVKSRLKEGAITIPEIEQPVEVNRIYTAIVRDLLLLAQEELANRGMDPVTGIVFTFPAKFADDAVLLEQMQAGIEQIELNGQKVHVLGRLPEPAAVAIDYLYYMQHLAPEENRLDRPQYTVLVYDLGHGTFDAAVVTAQEGDNPYRLHFQDGLPEVGGKDFDEILYTELCRRLREEHGYTPRNDRERETVRTAAVSAKWELTGSQASIQQIPAGEEYFQVEITRERFEQLSSHLMFQTLELVQSLLDEAEAAGISIDAIVLSGGASKMPMVRRGLEALTEGRCPIVLYRPSEAVSYGAARYAQGIGQTAQASNAVLEQLTDCCYGIWMPAEDRPEGEIRFLLPNGVKRPAVSKPAALYSNSSRVNIKLYASLAKNQPLDAAGVEDCRSVMWFPFDVTPGVRYEVQVTALENYSMEVELKPENGPAQKKSTASGILEIKEE